MHTNGEWPTAVFDDTTENQRTPLEVAGIFRQFGDAFLAQYPVSPEQRTVIRDIIDCRTAALGGHIDACDSCGGLRIAYNSCRNRHCPKCGALAKAEWLEAQAAYLLPTHYFHVVFTIDHGFNPIAQSNPRQVYNLLFQSAAETLKSFGRIHLGGEIGFTSVLHTWGQKLTRHIHLHCLVPGGALFKNGKRWVSTSPTFLFPIEDLSAAFRDRFCEGMRQLYRKKKLHWVGDSRKYEENTAFFELVKQAEGKNWQVFAKPPFRDALQTLEYLGRYVNRMAISNYRIRAITGTQVTFSYRDYQDGSKEKELTVTGIEFMRRLLQHVLPSRFVRVRHYGLLAPKQRKAKIAQCRVLLGEAEAIAYQPKTREEILEEMLGYDPASCQQCGEGKMVRFEELAAHPRRRNWQKSLR